MSATRYIAFLDWRSHSSLSRERIEQALVLALRIGGAGLGYIIIALAARATSTEGFGDFVLLLSSTALFGGVATLGQESILLRDLPIISSRGYRGFRELMDRSLRRAGVGLLIFAGLGVAYGLRSFSNPDFFALLLLALLVISNGLNELNFAVQRGRGNTLGAVLLKEVAWKFLLASGLIFLVMTNARASVASLGLMFFLALLLPLTISSAFIVLQWIRAPKARGETQQDLPKASGFAFFALNFISQAGSQIDVLVLGIMTSVSSVELGAYYAAQRTIQVLYLLPYGASITSAPLIPLAFAEGNRNEIVRLSRQISRGVGAAVIFLSLILLLFRTEILSMFRPEFGQYSLLLPVLSLGPLVSAIGGLHSLVAPMCGMEREYARARILIMCVATVGKVALASKGMLLGLAFVNAAEALVTVATGVLMARVRLKIWII